MSLLNTDMKREKEHLAMMRPRPVIMPARKDLCNLPLSLNRWNHQHQYDTDAETVILCAMARQGLPAEYRGESCTLAGHTQT